MIKFNGTAGQILLWDGPRLVACAVQKEDGWHLTHGGQTRSVGSRMAALAAMEGIKKDLQSFISPAV